MTNPAGFIVLVTAETVWRDVAWWTIVFLAALGAIDPTLYEAAAADGTGRGVGGDSGILRCRGSGP